MLASLYPDFITVVIVNILSYINVPKRCSTAVIKNIFNKINPGNIMLGGGGGGANV